MRAGEVLDARYELVRRLDVGGMGEVWEGIDRRIRRKVAIKLIREEADPALVPELVSRLGREATAAGRLAHPHIVAVYDYNSVAQDDVPLVYIVMELVRGRSLAEELAQRLPPLPQALAWAEQIALALESAHGPEAGVVHRDLKPGNVMVTYGGLVKLLDFGIARFLEDNDTHHTKLTGARMVGTPAYMAPEQCDGRPVDGRTDLYALGCLLYTMLTGRPPFTLERGLLQVMYQQVHEVPPPPSALLPVPGSVDRLVMDLLAKDPADRPADAAQVVDRLRTLSRTLAATAAGPAAAAPAGAGSAGAGAYVPTEPDLPAGAPSVQEPAEDEDEDANDDEVLEGEYADPDPGEVFSARIRAALVERGRVARAEDDPGIARLALGELLTDTVRLFGAEDPLTVGFGFDLACACARDGLFGEASALLGRIVPHMEALHGPEDRRTLYARCLLPWYLASAGALREAAELYADVVRDLRRVLGETDSLTLHTRYQYVTQLAKSGDDVGAVQLWLSLIPRLDSEQRTVGALGADARRELCDAVLRLRGNAEAAARLRVLVSHLVGLLEDGREETYAARIVMAGWVADAGTAQETLPTWRVLISDCTAALGEEHPLTLLARFRLAEHTEGAGRPSEARALLVELMPALYAHQGPAGELVLRARYLLALTTRAVDPAADLAQWEELAPDLEALLGSGDRLTVDAWFRLALALSARDRQAEALALLNAVLPRRGELFGADEPVTLRGRCAQAAGVAALHGEAVARPMWRELLAELTRALGGRHELTRGVRERLGLVPEPEEVRSADLPGLGPVWTVRAT
ncbi:serine/threonine protein kinase [Streptomyces sp. NBC_00335]|uniref:serine/threonine-protein kinase n=1 Tax=unclassified Streptomyces TaxID=2593676 RepID=UPI002251378A|nr:MULTISPECIES: serine/threonine-protein kinase [unclassified Streptomyces]MCX5407599.1 serine/threonine protein kinase [Streptomyces sp. NBC_00086]